MTKVKNKKESFMKGILTLMFAQVIIKILGLLYSLYLTNRQGFGDSGNAIYMSGYQIYAMLLTLSSTGGLTGLSEPPGLTIGLSISPPPSPGCS